MKTAEKRTGALRAAARQARALASAIQKRDAAIRDALTAGASLADVAAATGLSREGVRQIANRETER